MPETICQHLADTETTRVVAAQSRSDKPHYQHFKQIKMSAQHWANNMEHCYNDEPMSSLVDAEY